MKHDEKKETTAFRRGLTLGLRILYPLAAALLFVVLCEWCARGTLESFWESYVLPHFGGYFLAWLFLVLVYAVVDSLSRFAPLATLVTGLLACVPGAVNYYTLELRGEPFLPWDLAQVSEAAGVVGAAGVIIQKSMVWSAVLVLALTVLSFFLYRSRPRTGWKGRVIRIAASAAGLLVLVFGVYLRPEGTEWFGIYSDAWMQDRYYRNYGVITGFLSNLQNLEIDKPENYSEEAVQEILDQVAAGDDTPLFADSYAARTEDPEQKPTIIYVMDESYWDVSVLEDYGFAFDTDVSANLHRLQQSAVSGKLYSPSFGGGTCDVEFEALTGYSMTFLPDGSKPFQQHVTRDMFSLPNYLKSIGYQTTALHCFYAKYWSRNTAYPNLGFDDFISLEDMTGLGQLVRSYYWKSGLVSDADMGKQIIQTYETLSAQSDAPIFLHAVTMQNHTNYNAANYPEEELVKVTAAPEGVDEGTIGALEDFATGVRDADQLLGTLTDYFSTVDEPVILVFWGDHYNPINSNYQVYTASGYATGGSADPALHETTLLMWSNYDDTPVDIGTIAAYETTPVMMDVYGLEKPAYYQYLTQQLSQGYRSYTCGVVVNPDGSYADALTEEQQTWSDRHWLLQYDLMFGKEYARTDTENAG